jgi:hypothetical protein
VRLVQVKQEFPEPPAASEVNLGSRAVRVSRERTSFFAGPFFFIDRLLLTERISAIRPCGY